MPRSPGCGPTNVKQDKMPQPAAPAPRPPTGYFFQMRESPRQEPESAKDPTQRCSYMYRDTYIYTRRGTWAAGCSGTQERVLASDLTESCLGLGDLSDGRRTVQGGVDVMVGLAKVKGLKTTLKFLAKKEKAKVEQLLALLRVKAPTAFSAVDAAFT